MGRVYWLRFVLLLLVFMCNASMKNIEQQKCINTVWYVGLDGNIHQERIESQQLLVFLYSSLVGKVLRPLFNGKLACLVYGWVQQTFFSKKKIESFVKKYSINMDDFSVPEGGFTSFNDFFIRQLRPGARTIDSDPATVVSPADSKLFVVQNISIDSFFHVKNKRFILKNFLKDEILAKKYIGGTLLLFRLSPCDYHRFHFPFDAQPSAAICVKGNYDSVNPIVYKNGLIPLLKNNRVLIVLETEQFSDVLLVPVGAMLVGKIISTYTVGEKGKKGDEMGYFSFGGSSIVLLFKKGIIKPLDFICDHSKRNLETQVLMGQAVALLNPDYKKEVW